MKMYVEWGGIVKTYLNYSEKRIEYLESTAHFEAQYVSEMY